MNEIQVDMFEPSFGTAPGKLHRRRAPDTSIAAAYRVDTATDEARAYAIIKAAGPQGTTLRVVARAMNKQLNAVSGRITALLDKYLIEDTGERHERCRVYRAR